MENLHDARAAGPLEAVARLLLESLVEVLVREMKLNYELLEKSTALLTSIDAVMNDAEKKQIRKPDVKNWIREVVDASFDVEECLEIIAYEALRCKVESQSGNVPSKVLSLESSTAFDAEILNIRILQIHEKLESLVKLKSYFGLKEDVQNRLMQKLCATVLLDAVPENYFHQKLPLNVLDSDVYGRDTEKEDFIKLLLSDVVDTVGNISVIPICGMGGIGKTTLAQLVFNDTTVNTRFDLKAWVSVSEEEFDIFKFTKSILETLTCKPCYSKDLNFLLSKLDEALMGKRFLLVLDDIWDGDSVPKDSLKIHFGSVRTGSKIVVTTRSKAVAHMVGDVPSFNLQMLSFEHSFQLFAKHAFNELDSGAFLRLQIIGREIVRKCECLPLSAKLLGCLLRFDLQQEAWESILNSDEWDLYNGISNSESDPSSPITEPKETVIPPALWLSYHYLPRHLKQCFAVCSIFPKHYEVTKEMLIKIWMALGLLQPQKDMRIEEVGHIYLNHLMSSSLLQQSRSSQLSVTMHDLLRDLATLVSKECYFRLDDQVLLSLVSKMQGKNSEIQKLKSLSKAKVLLASTETPWRRVIGKVSVSELVQHEVLPRLQSLRVLSLVSCPILDLPSSVCSLNSLRYLDLSFSLLKEVPDAICSLYNLETLLLSNCRRLSRLPTDMANLINLRHLDIKRTRLTEMPMQMGRLENLQTLSDFVLGKQSGSGIEELKELQHLHGKLCISGIQNVGDVGNVLEANLKDKKFLSELHLKWDGDSYASNKEREVLDGLQPHANLEMLKIKRYGGLEFPNWLGDHLYSNMVSVYLKDCKHCYLLPPLGQLASLKKLDIVGFDSVRTIGHEFYYKGSSLIKPFRCLESLSFCSMSEWHKWFVINDSEGGGLFPKLEHLYLEDCPKLYETLPYGLPSLRSLQILGCQQIVALIPQDMPMRIAYPSLQTIEIYYCANLESLPEGSWPANLKSLIISHCEKLTPLNKKVFQDLKTLENLCISSHECHELQFLAKENLPSLLSFSSMSGCTLRSEDWPEIADISPVCFHGDLRC